MEELCRFNQSLQDHVLTLQERRSGDNPSEDNQVMNPLPLSDETWSAPILKNFKLPSLVKFNGKRDSRKHIDAINNQLEKNGTYDSIKFKLLSGTYKEMTLRLLMNSPIFY